MRFSEFEWDEANTEHIARHQVTPEEAEEVFGGQYMIRKTREERYIALGQTEEGRYLAVVFARKGNKVRIITARNMDDKERYLFKRKEG